MAEKLMGYLVGGNENCGTFEKKMFCCEGCEYIENWLKMYANKVKKLLSLLIHYCCFINGKFVILPKTNCNPQFSHLSQILNPRKFIISNSTSSPSQLPIKQTLYLISHLPNSNPTSQPSPKKTPLKEFCRISERT